MWLGNAVMSSTLLADPPSNETTDVFYIKNSPMKPLPHPARHSGKTSNPHGKTTKINSENKQLQISGLNTGHDCLAAHLHSIKIFSHNYCTICKLKNTTMDKNHLLVCPKLDHTPKELSKLYWDARRLME